MCICILSYYTYSGTEYSDDHYIDYLSTNSVYLIIRSFICNTKRPSVKQTIKCEVSSNFQIYPGKTDEPPQYQTCMTTLQI